MRRYVASARYFGDSYILTSDVEKQNFNPPLNNYLVIYAQITNRPNSAEDYMKLMLSKTSCPLDLRDLRFTITLDNRSYRNVIVPANFELLSYAIHTDSLYEMVGESWLQLGEWQTYMLMFPVKRHLIHSIPAEISWRGRNGLVGQARYELNI